MEKIKTNEGVKVGDIFTCEWGYDQTNQTFYQVQKLVGKASVIVARVNPPIVARSEEAFMAENVTFDLDCGLLDAIDEPFRKTVWRFALYEKVDEVPKINTDIGRWATLERGKVEKYISRYA